MTGGRPAGDDAMRDSVIAAANGDTHALQALLVQHLPSLEAYVRLEAGAAVRGRESISDLVQSVCVEVLRDAARFEYRGEHQFRHWLFKQALHKIVNKNRFLHQQRRDVRRERPIDAGGERDSQGGAPSLLDCYATICTPSRVAIGNEAIAGFERAFDELPADYREVIALHRVVGMPFGEIAPLLGRSEGAARNLFHRAIARLSTILEKQDRERAS